MRLIFVARKFDNMAGGLERISIDLMNAMVGRGHAVSLMTWDRKDAATHYALDSRVQWLKLDIGNPDVAAGPYVKVARIMTFRKFVSSFGPDAILGFQSGAALFSRIATLGMGINVIAAERVSPDMWKYVRTGLIDRLTDIYSLMLADRITVQFSSYVERYPRILRRRMVAIHNPVFEPNSLDSGEREKNGKVLLYVARLCYQKNHEFLIEAFSRICDVFSDWKLVLVGEGEYDKLLRDKVALLGLEQRVVFCGAVKTVSTWYRSADLVAFPSLFEGFPNALAESLSWGLPCIGLKKTLGVNCLIEDGFNGILTDDSVEAFANGLAVLMADENQRIRMASNAKLIVSRYSPEQSYDLWETLIKEVASC
jgi:GalNAc-alpha-(1->4)-GalNAc-alpha-(1->3)-diNAcBac-PP-undecaprenol alpha-1,4-N-acetyl-D-galactosaminyltransferase